jgi:ferredoxin
MLTIKVMNNNDQNTEIVCREQESLLDAVNRQGFKIPYACKGGGCGLCKIKVQDGQFDMLKCSKVVLPDEERLMNYTLACKTYPKTHMEILIDLAKVEA